MEIFGAWVVKGLKRSAAAPSLSEIRSRARHGDCVCPTATDLVLSFPRCRRVVGSDPLTPQAYGSGQKSGSLPQRAQLSECSVTLGIQQREEEPRTFCPTLSPRSRSTRQQYENRLEMGSIGNRENPECPPPHPPPHQRASISPRPDRFADGGRRREVRGCARARGGLGRERSKAGPAGLQPPRPAPFIGALRLLLHGDYLCHVRGREADSRSAAERGAMRGGGDRCTPTQSVGAENRTQRGGRQRSRLFCGAGAAPRLHCPPGHREAPAALSGSLRPDTPPRVSVG